MTVQTLDGVHGDDSTKIFVKVNGKHENLPSALFCVDRYGTRMSLYQKILTEIQAREPNMSALAERARIGFDQVRNFYNGTNTGIKSVSAMLEAMGAKIVWPDERTDLARDICWVDAKVVSAGDGQKLPPSEAYFAVPLVGEAGAGPGVMPTDEIKSWVLVYRHQHAIRFKRNLLAVEIEKGSTSMVPLLRPGDIVLVDRDDCDPGKPGGIFLVREPGQEGGAMVKRVATKPVDHDLLITFYSENAAENPADTFSLNKDYDGEISKAIVGRCVWAWADITGK